MRTKVTFLLLALNFALFGYLFLSERLSRPLNEREQNRHRVLGPEAANLVALEITAFPDAADPGLTQTNAPEAARSLADATAPVAVPAVRLERSPTGDAWFLKAPIEWPANEFAVRRILKELQFLENETSFPVAELAGNGQSLADYGLAHPRLVINATPAPASPGATAPAPFTLRVGASTAVGNRVYVLSPDGTRIHVVAQSFGAAFGADPAALLASLRSDQLFTIPVFEARALTLQSASASARTRLRRDQTTWAFEAPITTRAAKTPVELVINELNALRVTRFLPPETTPAPSPETSGIAANNLRITLEGNGRRETLLLRLPPPATPPAATPPSDGETIEVPARLDERPTAFTVTVPVKLLTRLDQAQTELRDRRVLAFDPARVTSVIISPPEGIPPGPLRLQKLDATTTDPAAWQISSAGVTSPVRADSAVIERLLQRLQLLDAITVPPRASPFVSDAPSRVELENFGFNRPERTVTLELAPMEPTANAPVSGPTRVTLELALPGGGDSSVYARVTGQPFIYAIPPETLPLLDVAPISYRDRSLARLPDATQITHLVIRSTADPAAAPLLDYSPSSIPPPAPVATLLSALRDLRAGRIVRETYPETVPVDGVERPWSYRLEATLAPPGDGPLVLTLAERASGMTQLAGSPARGLVFTLEQPVLDALWILLYPTPKPLAPPGNTDVPVGPLK